MRSAIKRILLGSVIIAAILSISLCMALIDFSPRVSAEAVDTGTVNVTHISQADYKVEYNGGAVDVAADKSMAGGALALGPANCTKTYKTGISFVSRSATVPTVLTVKNDGYDLFTTEFGVDGESVSAVARFVFKADGIVVLEKTATLNAFQQTTDVKMTGVDTLSVEVYGVNATVVLGGADLYAKTDDAVSAPTGNVVYGGWPAPLSRNANFYGATLAIANKTYPYGFCLNSVGSFDIEVATDKKFFAADIGIDEGNTPGLQAGSATVTAEALDEGENVLNRVETPILYDYKKPYRLSVSVVGASKLRITVGDGGDGITNDMTVIGAPVFTDDPESGAAVMYGDRMSIVDLDYRAESGWGSPGIDKDVVGNPLTVNGVVYERGICLHAFSQSDRYAHVTADIPQDKGYSLFAAKVGVGKDYVNNGTAGSVRFYVEGDGQRLYSSELMRYTDNPDQIVVDISGVKQLRLLVDNGDGSYECDFAVWIDPVIARSTEVLDDYLRLDSPVDGKSVAVLDGSFEVSGMLLGKTNVATVSVDGKLLGRVTADRLGRFSESFALGGAGKMTVEVAAEGLVATAEINVALPIAEAQSYTLATKSTSVTFTPAKNGIVLNDISRIGGHKWLTSPSFIAFPSEVKKGENGDTVTLDWTFEKCVYNETDHSAKKINALGEDYTGKYMTYTATYGADGGKYRLSSVWSAYSDFAGPVSHSVQIENNSGVGMFVTAADSFSAELSKPSGEFTVSYAYKGAMYETAYGYRCDTVNPGYDMEVFSSTDYNNGMNIDAGYMPWTTLHGTKEGLNIGVVWSDCRLHVYGTDGGAYVKAGMRPRFKTVIPDGSAYLIPETFFDAYGGSIDDGSNQLKKWLFAFSMPEVNRLDDTLPSYSFNFWEVLDEERRSWRMSDAKFYAAVHQLAEMGVEEITVDTYWWKELGDWRGVHEKWQSSMTHSSEYVHSLGLDFTIYMQAGNGGASHTDALTAAGIHANPDWFARGENISWDEVCLADPDAYEYLSAYLKNYFMEHGLDGMRTDFGYLLGYCGKKGHAHIDERADVGYWTSVNWYSLLDELYELFPVPTDVNGDSEVRYYKWENCNCGGTHKDFASMRRASRVQTTDAYDPINVRRSFYDASYMFPSMQLMLWMNDYMYNPDGPYPNDNYRFWSQLLGSPCPMISMPSDMSPATYYSLANSIKIYKNWMRELVKYGNLYHILPRADGMNWDGIQYFDPDTGKGAVLAFKPDPDGTVDDTVTLKFAGIDPEKSYYVWSEEGYIPFATYKGSALIGGLDLTIDGSYGAEIIYFIDTTADGAAHFTRRPDDFAVTAASENDGLEINVQLADNIDYYVFDIVGESTTVYSFIADGESAMCNIIKGLPAGAYRVEVTGFNRFGTLIKTVPVTVETSSRFSGALEVKGADEGEAVIDGERYVGGNVLDLSDKIFSVASSRTVEIDTLGRDRVSFRLALPDVDADCTAEIEIYGVNGSGKTLIESRTVSASDKFVDVTVAASGYDKLSVTAENTSPDVFVQSATGYGRTGLYGGSKSTEYEFSFDVTVLRNGLNETFPRAGGFAAYVSDDSFAAVYIDAYYSRMVIYERRNGRSSDVTVNIKMPDGFDYYAEHNIKVVRNGNTFRYYVDGTLIATRTLALAPSEVAIITEDAQARFANVVRKVNGSDDAEKISWRKYDINVDIKDKTAFGGTRFTQGVWKRPEVKLEFIAY